VDRTAPDIYFVFLESSTHEEEVTWEDLKAGIESGRIKSDSLVFNSESKNWEKAGSRDELKILFDNARVPAAGETAGDGLDEEFVKKENYDNIIRELASDPNSLDLHMRAARAASAIGRQKEARLHYQQALNIRPYYPRLAQEIKRSLPPKIYNKFSLLERKPPWWEDPAALAACPIKSGWRSISALAAFLGAVLAAPFGKYLFVPLCLIVCVHVMKRSFRGAADLLPRGLHSIPMVFSTPALLAAAFLSAVEILSPFLIGACAALFASGGSMGQLSGYIAGSPLMSVLLFVLFCVYYPGALVVSMGTSGNVRSAVNPLLVVRTLAIMEMEYLASAAFLALIALLWLGFWSLIGRIPIFGGFAAAAAAAYALVAAGFILGRLAGRYAHLFNSSASIHPEKSSSSSTVKIDSSL